jgi:transcriptional regulator with XRE-family HTH domain
MLVMPRAVDRPRSIEREVNHRLRRINRTVGEDIIRIRTDAGATKAKVAAAAGVDRTFLGRIESGDVNPSLETLVSVATAMGADLSIRIYAGSGPRLTDRHQARMVESVLARLAPVWHPHLEVPVWRPARGVIDGVFERLDTPLLVVSEFMSTLPRLEQQLRWSAEKAASMASAELVGDRPVPPVSRLLVLRSTSATRQLAQRFELTLRTAYPGRTIDAVHSLTLGDPWPGDTLIWVRIEGDLVELMDRPPRGVHVGR